MTVLRRCRTIRAPFLASLASQPTLYARCALPVQQQIWEHDPTVFRREVFPVLTELIAEDNPVEPLYDMLHDETTPGPAERRRESDALQRVLKMVGSRPSLYAQLLETARALFLSTKNDRF